MIEAAGLLLLLGLASAVVLAIASRVFYVWEDPKVLAITDALPGANCGGCGFAGCAASAEAIASGKAPLNACVVGGFEVAQAIGKIMGMKVEAREPEFSFTSCSYGVGDAEPVYIYNGAMDCRAAVMLYGGSKLCPIGCIGLGSCVKACQFNALSMGDNNLPVVNYDNCVGCGACVSACPKQIVSLTSETRRIQGEYTINECTAPCQRACPTGINIPKYIREIREGDYEGALRTIKEKCPLPLVCGYICPAPCELECRRNLSDEGVAIDLLKRFVADYEMTTGRHVHPYKAPDNGRRIAVVGGGSEGLTAGYYLARLGYKPTVFEAKSELGGILRYVISEDRLPRNVLDHDIKGILDIGVEARTGAALGRDFTAVGLLEQGFDAVMLTTGGFDSRKILSPDLPAYSYPFKGLYIMLDLLNCLKRDEGIDIGKNIMIIDGGIMSLEFARRCLRMGAEKATLVFSQGQDSLPEEFSRPKALRAEGIEVRSSTAIAGLSGNSDRLTSADLFRLDSDGPELRKEIVDVDTVVAGGARIPELVMVHSGGELPFGREQVEWQTVETFRTFPGGVKGGVFASPEPGRISDSSAVVKSILSGRRLARAVHQHFSDGRVAPLHDLVCESDEIITVRELEGVTPKKRERPSFMDVEGDSKAAWVYPEILPGLDEEAARREAERCLQCGLICYKKG